MPLEELLRGGRVRPIVRWGEPVMHRKCQPVTTFDDELWTLLRDMFATNKAANGAGLAAPQVGIDLAVFIYDCSDAAGLRRRGVVCNPITTTDETKPTDTDDEGCLSLPGAFMPVTRPAAAATKGQDQDGAPVFIRGTGLLARCLQHETDHLHGIVMEDHLGMLDKRNLRRQHRKAANDFPPGWPA